MKRVALVLLACLLPGLTAAQSGYAFATAPEVSSRYTLTSRELALIVALNGTADTFIHAGLDHVYRSGQGNTSSENLLLIDGWAFRCGAPLAHLDVVLGTYVDELSEVPYVYGEWPAAGTYMRYARTDVERNYSGYCGGAIGLTGVLATVDIRAFVPSYNSSQVNVQLRGFDVSMKSATSNTMQVTQ